MTQLVDVVYQEDTLLNVSRSVTRNWRSIALTALLALILVYLFSIVGYLFLQDDFVYDVNPLRPSINRTGEKSLSNSSNSFVWFVIYYVLFIYLFICLFISSSPWRNLSVKTLFSRGAKQLASNVKNYSIHPAYTNLILVCCVLNLYSWGQVQVHYISYPTSSKFVFNCTWFWQCGNEIISWQFDGVFLIS